MFTLRPSAERGGADHGWLKTRHTFSFNTYRDAAHMHFRALRVINEDWIAPSQGFGTHPHDNMEIITYVLEGALEHKDSLGTGSIIRPGDAQRMSAGAGIRHSEYNASKTDQVHMLQIWIMPNQRNLAPGYEQKVFPAAATTGKLLRIGQGAREDDPGRNDWGENESRRDGRPRPSGKAELPTAPVTIHADADLYVSVLKAGESVTHTLAPSRHAWLQVTRGSVELNGKKLTQGDGASASNEPNLEIQSTADSEILLFDLA
jgi:redox-sensitive bicupin YhaK (pirin superfamily)